MKLFLTACLLAFLAVPAFAQDNGKAERMGLAKRLNQVNPASKQIEDSVLRVGESWGLAEKEKFRSEMMAKMDTAKIEQTSIDALAATFTKEELQVMINYYSAPEAAKVAEKMPLYQGRIQPVISKELDRALMALRTGYEAQEKTAPAVPVEPSLSLE